MARHAYCIIAHKDTQTLNALIDCLDDERNDIFLYIDRKNKQLAGTITQPLISQLITPPYNKTQSIYWGDISQVKAELEILHTALEYGDYEYFHLLSGQDMPLHSQDYIHGFFANVSPGTNFIGYTHGSECNKILTDRLTFYIPFMKYYKSSGKYKKMLFDRLRNFITHIEHRFNLKRKYTTGIEFRKGCNWASMTADFVKYILKNKTTILRMYKGVPCCDEIYKQTLAWNSEFKSTIYRMDDEYEGCLREIDWDRGNPYTYRINDLKALSSSNKLFARKFDSELDKLIVDALHESIKNNKYHLMHSNHISQD